MLWSPKARRNCGFLRHSAQENQRLLKGITAIESLQESHDQLQQPSAMCTAPVG